MLFLIFISQNFGAQRREVGQAWEWRQGNSGIHGILYCSFRSCIFIRRMADAFCLVRRMWKSFRLESAICAWEGAFYCGIGVLFLLYGYFRGINRPEMSVLTVISLGTRVVLGDALAPWKLLAYGYWWAFNRLGTGEYRGNPTIKRRKV